MVDKACFQHDITYEDRHKVLRVKAFSIGKNPRYDGYQRGLNSMVYKFFDKKTADGTIENEIKQDEKLAEELHKPTNKHKPIALPEKYIHRLEIIFGSAGLADMRLINICNKGIRGWIVPLKDKKGVTITYTFQKVLDKSKLKPNKVWVDEKSEFYNRSMKSWLQDNNIEMYSTHNEGKSVVAERLIRTLKTKIYKYITSTSKN